MDCKGVVKKVSTDSGHESEIEDRLVDEDCTIESLKAGNRDIINGFQHAGEQVVLISSSPTFWM